MSKALRLVAVSAQKQRGAVLVIALLIIAIITTLAVDFSSRFQLSVGRAENRLFSGQMQQSLLSLEHATMWALREDKKDDDNNGNKTYDHLAEEWAKSNEYKILIQAEFEDVIINELTIEDVQGRFNINQLATRSERFDASKAFFERYTASEKRFMRLLQTVPNNIVGTAEAEAITQAVMDWLDRDNNVTGAGGAESDYYLSQDPPFRTANTLITSISELRLIKGISDEIYEWIAPLLVALPDNEAGINVNTALPVVLQSLNGAKEEVPISIEDAETLEGSRPTLVDANTESENLGAEVKEEGFKSIEEFMNSNELETVFSADAELQPEQGGLTTGSQYFALVAEVEIDGIKRRAYSLLKRDVDPKSNATRVRVFRRGAEDFF